MKKMVLILGGARSGKSTYALSLAHAYKKVAFVATCEALDKEMKRRIELHKDARPKHWTTFEEPRDLDLLIEKMDNRFDCILIDCLTLLVSNLILKGDTEKEVIKKIESMLTALRKKKARAIMVSNEVGLGLVPANKLGRDFRDIAGKVNQLVAREADEAFFLVAGVPLVLKK